MTALCADRDLLQGVRLQQLDNSRSGRSTSCAVPAAARVAFLSTADLAIVTVLYIAEVSSCSPASGLSSLSGSSSYSSLSSGEDYRKGFKIKLPTIQRRQQRASSILMLKLPRGPSGCSESKVDTHSTDASMRNAPALWIVLRHLAYSIFCLTLLGLPSRRRCILVASPES